MRYVILAIFFYLVYIIVKGILRAINNKETKKVEDEAKNKSRRSYDLNQAEDAEFREIKKD
jgi:cell division protein FtsB